MTDKRPTFLTNDSARQMTVGGTLARHLNVQIAELKEPPSMDIASAYFNPGGFQALKEPLGAMSHVRLLLGAEPDNAPLCKTTAWPGPGSPAGTQPSLSAAETRHRTAW
ncbi:hypothetical protein [Corynebacterium cystitidis]|uniref:hypothetical protein n=1 Tax=Corynebacterium cystitidis TaxID=35757 RepID=UPI0015A5DDB0|nr:hypothetical protein [Corynebacterium cystitidis]